MPQEQLFPEYCGQSHGTKYKGDHLLGQSFRPLFLSLYSVLFCFTEHGSVGSLWPQRQIITLFGSRQTAKLPCISVDQRIQGSRYLVSPHCPFLCPQFFTPGKKKKIKLKLSCCANSCNTPLGNQEF